MNRSHPKPRLLVRGVVVLTSLYLVGTVVWASPAAATATWGSAGDLALARIAPRATLLSDGRVLVTGGNTPVGTGYDTKSVEVYDPQTNSWSATGSLTNGRDQGHTATGLADGKVLVTGGVSANICANDPTAELYDPATGTWSATGSLATARYFATATRLADGRVLVTGGGDRCGTVFSSAEIYDPATGTWSATGSMTTPREFHDAVRLPDGRVLVTGGAGPFPFPILSSAEIYDPATGTWTATGSMGTTRCCGVFFLTPLADGRVMAAGGYSGTGFGLSPNGPGVEIYDPTTGTWSATGSMSVGRSSGTLSLLGNGMVLAAGGTDGTSNHSTAELWDPATGTWSATASMAAARTAHSATVLSNGKVLVATGYDAPTYLTSAELYSPFSYDFTGFLSPVNNPPTVNLTKAGSAVPIKFSLNGDQGLDVFAAGYPRSRSVTCETSDPVDGLEQTVTAGASVLSYDPILDQYTYVWKTRKDWKGSCRRLEVMLGDGSLYTANFQFN